jgi:hypothetical protein
MQKYMIKRKKAYQDTNQELASHWEMEQVQNMEHAWCMQEWKEKKTYAM